MNFIVNHATPKAKTETLKDPILQEVSECIIHNTWHNIDLSRHADMLKQFRKVSGELTNASGLVLRGTRIVIPTTLQDRVIQLAHEGH